MSSIRSRNLTFQTCLVTLVECHVWAVEELFCFRDLFCPDRLNERSDADSCIGVGWPEPIERVYLKSLLEFTFPGYSNDGVKSLSDGKTAGSGGIWRNVTQGGIQDTAVFQNRADGVIVYVPGYGVDGILVSMAGGNNISFVSPNTILTPRI